MEQLILDVLVGAIRWILWSIAALAIQIINLVFIVVKQALVIDLFKDYPFAITLYYGFILVFFGYFVFFRIIKMALKYFVDEEFSMRLTMRPTIVFRRTVFAVLIIIATPFVLSFLSSLISMLVDNIGTFFNNGQEIDVSTLFCSIGNIAKPKEAVTCPDFLNPMAINEKLADGSYKYFSDTFSILLPIFGAMLSIKVLLALLLSITNRSLGVVFRMIIAPYSLSGFIEENNNSFATWSKLQAADLIMNFIQMIMLIVAFHFPLSIQIKGDVFFVSAALRLALFVGSLFAIIQAPGNLAQLIGSDASAVAAHGNLSTIQQNINSSLKTTGSIVKTAVAGATVMTLGAFMGSSPGSLETKNNFFANAATNMYRNSMTHLQNTTDQLLNRRR